MKKYLTIILSTFLVAGIVNAFQPATLFIETWNGIKKQAVYSQEQADKLFKDGYKLYQGDNLGGVAYTTISGSDTMKNFPTVYNANNALFDAGKIDVGTTSVASITTLNSLTSASALATVGTITSGSWNATAIPVNKGGTGTTSPSLYQVILGNGSSGLTIASGTGASGQFLTSNGAGAYPSWQSSSVDQSANYTWTGNHTFATTTTASAVIASSTIASSTITSLNTPTLNNKSTNYIGGLLYATTTLAEFTASAGKLDFPLIATTTIPADVISTAGNIIRAKVNIKDYGLANTKVLTFRVIHGTTATNVNLTNSSGGGIGVPGSILVEIISTGSASQKVFISYIFGNKVVAAAASAQETVAGLTSAETSENNAISQNFVIRAITDDSSAQIKSDGGYIEVIR